MDKYERIEAAVRGQVPDRLPLSLWQHAHCQDQTAAGLARATLEMAATYDLDLVKLTPCGLYAVEDWAGDRIVYPGTESDPPYMEPALIEQPGFWRSLPELAPSAPALRRELKAIQMVAEGLAGTTPLMMTIFKALA